MCRSAFCAPSALPIFIRPNRNIHREPFDFFGFLNLSLGVGALQLMLDRGELKDWFHSTEIWVEAAIAGLGFYLFTVHTVTTTGRSFLNRELLKSSNFIAGTMLMFSVGLIMTGTLALLPSDAAKPDELSGADDRTCDGAARHGDDGGDVYRRAADQPCR